MAKHVGRADGEWPREQPGPGMGAPYNVPSIFMPRWASRFTLHVTGIRTEPLQAITEQDARAEGVCCFLESTDKVPWGDLSQDKRDMLVRMQWGSAVMGYKCLWDTINGLSGPKSWDANPTVLKITFEVERANIDAARPARPPL